MPSSRAMRATAPESQGASRRPPASRSPSIEAFISGGRPSTKARVLATKSSGRATPRFLPTSQVSRIVASSSQRMSGSERTTPIGLRVTVVVADSATSRTNFSHSTRTMSSTSSASIFASRQAVRNDSAALLCAGRTGPKRSRAICPVWTITPGSAMRPAIYAAPPMTRSRPRTAPTRSIDSTPFWNGMTKVLLPTMGRNCAAAVSVSHSFTANTTTSTAPASAGFSTAFTFSCASPSGLFSARPLRCSACRCRPRAMNATGCPACCRRAPKYPPTPPDPMTAIFTSVPIVVGFVRTALGHADVARLLVGQLGQHRVELGELQPRHFLVELLGQDVHADRVLAVVAEELDLRQHLVGERGAHHVGGVPGGTAEVHQAPFGEQDDALAVGEDDVVDLRLDVLPLVLLEAGDFDLVVEVADVAHDGVVLHALHVLVRDDVEVAGRGNEDVRLVRGVIHGHQPVAFHRRLQRADRVDLGGALDAVDQRLAAAVDVVELRLGDRVVDVDRREEEPLLLRHLVEAMHSGRGFLGDASDFLGDLRVPARFAFFNRSK